MYFEAPVTLSIILTVNYTKHKKLFVTEFYYHRLGLIIQTNYRHKQLVYSIYERAKRVMKQKTENRISLPAGSK